MKSIFYKSLAFCICFALAALAFREIITMFPAIRPREGVGQLCAIFAIMVAWMMYLLMDHVIALDSRLYHHENSMLLDSMRHLKAGIYFMRLGYHLSDDSAVVWVASVDFPREVNGQTVVSVDPEFRAFFFRAKAIGSDGLKLLGESRDGVFVLWDPMDLSFTKPARPHDLSNGNQIKEIISRF